MPRNRFALSASALLLVVSPLSIDDEHVVERGDTIAELAAANHTTVLAIVEANDLSDPDVIRPGELLRIPGSSTFHVVEAKETLVQIAALHGTTAQALAGANGIIDPDLIFTGARLWISDAPTLADAIDGDSSTYVVKAGDTLGDIAARLGVSSKQLAERNNLADPNALRTGQVLVVSGRAFTCPVAGANYRNDFGVAKPDGRFHEGIDLFAPSGTAIVAPAAGRVEQVEGSLGGLQFWLHGADGNLYIGTHMSDFGLSGRVAAGDLVGFVGDSGNAIGAPPHLHFEIIVGGSAVNPYPTLRTGGC